MFALLCLLFRKCQEKTRRYCWQFSGVLCTAYPISSGRKPSAIKAEKHSWHEPFYSNRPHPNGDCGRHLPKAGSEAVPCNSQRVSLAQQTSVHSLQLLVLISGTFSGQSVSQVPVGLSDLVITGGSVKLHTCLRVRRMSALCSLSRILYFRLEQSEELGELQVSLAWGYWAQPSGSIAEPFSFCVSFLVDRFVVHLFLDSLLYAVWASTYH